MAKDNRKLSSDEGARADEVTSLEALIRQRARGLIDAIVEEELEAALGAAESARVGSARQGYRHGTRERTLTTSLGPTTFAMPRARLRTAEGATVEWRGDPVPRYQRRSERVDEGTAAWRDVIRSLAERHVGRPLLAIIDGSAGLAAALREQWPTLAIQRCTAHKLRNLEAKAPVRLREELAEDYRRMIYAETRTLVDQARTRFATTGRNYAAAGAECAQ